MATGKRRENTVSPEFRLSAFAPAVTENDVEARIRQYFARRGWLVIRQHVGLFKARSGQHISIGEKGMTDYVVVRPLKPGLALRVYVEVKRPGGEPSVDQLRWMGRARSLGHLAEYFDSVEDLARWFETRFGPRLDHLV